MSDAQRPVRVRIAPSPTGHPHVGTAYTALFNLAFARQQGGRFVLRIEDTDRTRFVEESEQLIFQYFRWLGLEWDEGPDVGGPYGPYRQSERRPLYQEHAERLVAAGRAYRCWCTPERLERVRREQQARGEPPRYDRFCLGKSEAERRALGDASARPVVRMLVPDGGRTAFVDLIRGAISFENRLLDDQVLLKSDGFPTYHLAVVVDDHLMAISHVLRGEEWISSTPKHILLYQFFGWEPPAFAHLPLLRNKDRSKVSKRRNPWAVLPWFAEQGYLPAALLNFLGLLGFSVPDPESPGGTREVFGFADLVEHFAFERISTTSPIFDLDKLDWLNGVYIRKLSVAELTEQLLPFLERAGVASADDRPYLERIVPLVRERLRKLSEAPELVDFFFAEELSYDPKLLVPKGLTPADAHEMLAAALERLRGFEPWEAAAIESALDAVAAERGWKRGHFFMTLRVAATGKTATPPLDQTLAVLGRERVERRFAGALRCLEETYSGAW
jgi:glutamyl-tRNA synthetase